MDQLTQEERAMVEGAGWTEGEVTEFRQAIANFRGGLPRRQQEAFNVLLATAGGASSGVEVQGYLVVMPIIAILIGFLPPDVQTKPRQPGT